MFKKFVLFMVLAALIVTGCEKDPTGAGDGDKNPKLSGAFILNEGNFNGGNGSLSFYSPKDGTIQNGIFKAVNGVDLGDVVQSMTIVDTLGFIVVNNSNKIEVISTNSWKKVTTINLPAGSSPRYLAYDDQFAYVTNLFGNNISKINLDTYQVESSIPVGTNPEMIVLDGNAAYVANSGFGWNNTVSVVNLAQGQESKTIKVGDNPRTMRKVNNDELHVLCEGRWPAWGDTSDTGTNGGLYVIDMVSNTVIDSFMIAGHPSRLAYDGDDTGYFLSGGQVVSYSTVSHSIVNDTLISGFFYGLEVDPVSKNIFTLDAKNYAQNGDLKIYSADGTLQESYETGIIPGSVTFVYEEE